MRTLLLFCSAIPLLWVQVSAQAVILNGPVAWQTMRTSEILVRAQFDTSDILEKTVQFSLKKHTDKGSALLSTKRVRVKNFTADVPLSATKVGTIGGKQFLSVVWSVVGDNEKNGTLAPLGIFPLGDEKFDAVEAYPLKSEKPSLKDIEEAGFSDGIRLGTTRFAFFYSKSFLVCANSSEAHAKVRYGFDGKNAKNGFLSYADRFVEYTQGKEGVTTFHFKRSFDESEGIVYERKEWHIEEVFGNNKANLQFVAIPWYAMGMTPPFAGRRLGICVEVTQEDGRETAFPASARQHIPGTWGDIVLVDNSSEK